MEPLTLCIYHGNCADGFGAAWVIRKALGEENVEFYPGVYQRPPPDVTDRDVILVDFSYKRPVLEQMSKSAKSIMVLDHHKTAADDLGDLPLPVYRDHAKLTALFDMERSGAGLAWDFFFPDEQRPQLIDFIEDRDLWRFRYAETRDIQANVFSYPYDFERWDELMAMGPIELRAFREQGQAIERKHFKDIDELLRIVTRPMKFFVPAGASIDSLTGVDMIVPVANLPYTLVSDAGHLLCERGLYGQVRPAGNDINALQFAHSFAACYYDGRDGRNFSLRSREGGADVGAIAKIYGGGGHKDAAGFHVPFNQLAQFEP